MKRPTNFTEALEALGFSSIRDSQSTVTSITSSEYSSEIISSDSSVTTIKKASSVIHLRILPLCTEKQTNQEQFFIEGYFDQEWEDYWQPVDETSELITATDELEFEFNETSLDSSYSQEGSENGASMLESSMINYLQECLMTDIILKRPLTLEEKDNEDLVKEEELFINQILTNLEIVEDKFNTHRSSNVVPIKSLIKFHEFSSSIRMQLGLRLSRMCLSKHSSIIAVIMQGGLLKKLCLGEQPINANLNKQSGKKISRIQKAKLFWKKQINRVFKKKSQKLVNSEQ